MGARLAATAGPGPVRHAVPVADQAGVAALRLRAGDAHRPDHPAAAVLTVPLLGRPPPAAVLPAASPAPGADLGTAPAAVILIFSAAVDQAHVSVSGARTDLPPSIDGDTVRQPLAATAAGQHVVS